MRTALQTLWYSLAAIALIVTIIAGVFTITEKVGNMTVGIYHQFVALRLSRISKRVLVFMKDTHPANFYRVEEIATSLKLTIRDTWDALERLEAKNRVRRSKLDVPGGFVWLLDELEAMTIH